MNNAKKLYEQISRLRGGLDKGAELVGLSREYEAYAAAFQAETDPAKCARLHSDFHCKVLDKLEKLIQGQEKE